MSRGITPPDRLAEEIGVDSNNPAVLGRVTPCAPPLVNERILICHDGAHGVTRPTRPQQFHFRSGNWLDREALSINVPCLRADKPPDLRATRRENVDPDGSSVSLPAMDSSPSITSVAAAS